MKNALIRHGRNAGAIAAARFILKEIGNHRILPIPTAVCFPLITPLSSPSSLNTENFQLATSPA